MNNKTVYEFVKEFLKLITTKDLMKLVTLIYDELNSRGNENKEELF